MRYRYPLPGNEDEFETFCVRLYRKYLKREGLIRYAKRGESQDGIDIIDQHAITPLYAIQCKNHEPTKTLLPSAIRKEVSLAEKSSHKIQHFIIATTAKKSKAAQDTVLNLNQNTTESRPFKVEIHFWEDICERLSELGQAVADFIISGERNAEAKLEANRLPGDRLTSIVAYASDTSDITGLYSDINVLFDQRKLEAAEHEIGKLPDPEVSSTLTTGERYGIFRLRAKLALEKQRFEDASRLFHMAYDICPTLPQALERV